MITITADPAQTTKTHCAAHPRRKAITRGFVLVGGVGAWALISRGGAAKARAFASRPSSIPVAPVAESAIPAAALPPFSQSRVPGGETLVGTTSSAPTLPSVIKESVPAALVVTQHLDATQTTSAEALASADSAPRQAEALPKREFIAPKLVAAKKEGISSTVHYGVNSRSELMGRAAGPIFNFKGRGAKKAETSDGNILSQVATQIEEARKQVEGSSLDDKTKKDLSEKLQLVNDGIGN